MKKIPLLALGSLIFFIILIPFIFLFEAIHLLHPSFFPFFSFLYSIVRSVYDFLIEMMPAFTYNRFFYYFTAVFIPWFIVGFPVAFLYSKLGKYKKKILILAVILSLVAGIFGIYYKKKADDNRALLYNNFKGFTLKDCEDKLTSTTWPADTSQCIYSFVKQGLVKKVQDCDILDHTDNKEDCIYTEVILNKDDPALCQKINNDHDKGKCYLESGDCEDITNTSDKDLCYNGRSFTTKNSKECLKITDKAFQASCLNLFEIQKMNSSSTP